MPDRPAVGTESSKDSSPLSLRSPVPVPRAVDPRSHSGQDKSVRGLGAFTFILHTHIPYCRMAGRWPHGEEWLHEAMAETYIPLLDALYDLCEEGIPYKLTMSLTPVLVEQLADDDVREHFEQYLDAEKSSAMRDAQRFAEEGDDQLAALAAFYFDTYSGLQESFQTRFGRDLVGAFRTLQDEGYVEILVSAATHGYLPLLSRDSSIHGQLRTGVESYSRHFGRPPRAIWLPECAYRPAYIASDGSTRLGIESFLASLGLGCFFVETHAIEGGRPVGKAGGDVAIGPYTAIKRRYVLPLTDESPGGGTTSEAYYALASDGALTDPPVAVLGRNNRTGQQVWSADHGYPGDFDYREFHKKHHESGLQYWRVTGAGIDLGDKDLYHPETAAQKVQEHAQHYARLVERLTREQNAETGRYGIISSNYDTELFGHWWFEGVTWIKETLRALSESEVVDLTTTSEYVAEHEPQKALAVPESSWGAGGTHWTWDNPETHWVWEPIHESERRMEGLVSRHPNAEGPARRALDQAARELLLLESSDWPFLMTTGQARHYAIERFRSHLARFQKLADMVESGAIADAAAFAAEAYELDKVFPHIDYRWFRLRQES